ncbi:MAG: hypothetical protein ABSA42_01380 [Terracidiphilus sp.]|jgi:hypothetical protein
MSSIAFRALRGPALFIAALAAAFFCAASLYAQMVSPEIDQPGQPFSYFSKPTDEIGVMGAEAGTEITPEGYLRTGFGELMFFAGPELEPTSVRIRTLEQGHLPIVYYEFARDGIVYSFTLFAATLDGSESGPLVNFIRVEMKNASHQPTRAIFSTGIRYDALSTTGLPHGDNRFFRPAEGKFPGAYRQIGEPFNRQWTNSFDAAHFFRDGRLLYSFPLGYAARGFTLRDQIRDMHSPDLSKPAHLLVEPETPVGIVTYSTLLPPGAERTLDFKMPVVPTADPQIVSTIDQTGFDAAKAQIVAYWNNILSTGMQIELPEAKAVDTFYTNLVYDLIAIDHIGPDTIQTVNKLHYHAFWLRDGADIVHSYDVTGYPQIARECLDFFAKSQKPDGNFLSQAQQYDGWGEAVWAYGQHYRITHDEAFAEWALPQIDRAVDWLHQARAADPLHIVPASDVRDNEYIPGHLTGYNFLALDGLRLAIKMASETGHADLAQKWQAEYDGLHQAFFKVLDAQAAAHNGYIPPVLDGQIGAPGKPASGLPGAQAGGYDWGNLLSVVPEPTLDPHDPRVTATLRAVQAKYAEGIMTYADGEFLHHYLTIKNTMTETIRGDQEQALNELYAILLHTSSTNAGFEYKIRPWGDRNFGDNLAPHGWFAAEYRTLLRTMLVREEGNQLHLLSVVSPAWIGKGKTVAVRQAPTYFGPLGFTLTQPSATEAVLRIDAHFDRAPKSIEIHLPWFIRLESATVDGAPITFSCIEPCEGGSISVRPTAREIRLHWSIRPNTPQLSYDRAVAAYKAEYARRYQALMHGEPAPKR